MQKLVLDIFDKVGTRIPYLSEGEEELAERVEIILQDLEIQVPQEYHDEISRCFFEVSGISERKGFELGMFLDFR